MSYCPAHGTFTLRVSRPKNSVSATPSDSAPSSANLMRHVSAPQRLRSASVPRSSTAPTASVTASTVSGSRIESRPKRLVGIVTSATVPQINNPPIVAVPALHRVRGRPSSEIAFPIPQRSSRATTGRPAISATTNAAPPTSSA